MCIFLDFLFAGVYQNIVLLVDIMCEKDSEGSALRSRKRDMFENLKICYHHFLCCSSPPSYNVTSPPFGKQLVSSPQESEPPLTECRDHSQPKIAVFPSLTLPDDTNTLH